METGEGSACAAQQYNLKWTNHTNNILEMFSEQLLNGLLVDVTLFCDGQFIRAHKMVLSACSPYFQELFKVHKVDHPVIFMNGVRYVAVKQMVEFMYQGEIKVSDEDLDQLLSIAENLQIKGLCKIRRENENEKSPVTPKKEPFNEEPFTPSPATPKRRKRRKTSQSPVTVEDLQTNGDFSAASVRCLPNIIYSRVIINFQQSTESLEDTHPVTKNSTIRRPKNAFMIFSGQWRRKLAKEYYGESNKEISMRLGAMWKTLSSSEKDEYFEAAKKVVEDHRLKYPDYHLAKEAKQALKGRRPRNPRQFKRKKSGASENSLEDIPNSSEPLEENQTKPTNEEQTNANAEDKAETDESNLVIAESQCSDSSGENSVSSKN
ncbi:hypothetical protein FQR65_LT04926 [Abscondita terminalis]|nr:hypothetical protein FQR65_LT04926 [Abscondita terminalis]